MPSSRGSSQPRDQTQVCCIAGRCYAISPRLPVLVILILKNLSILCAASYLYAFSLILENLLFFWFLFPFASIGYGWFFDKYYLNLFSMMGKCYSVVSLSNSLLLLWKLKVHSLSYYDNTSVYSRFYPRDASDSELSCPWGILLCDSCRKRVPGEHSLQAFRNTCWWYPVSTASGRAALASAQQGHQRLPY